MFEYVAKPILKIFGVSLNSPTGFIIYFLKTILIWYVSYIEYVKAVGMYFIIDLSYKTVISYLFSGNWLLPLFLFFKNVCLWSILPLFLSLLILFFIRFFKPNASEIYKEFYRLGVWEFIANKIKIIKVVRNRVQTNTTTKLLSFVVKNLGYKDLYELSSDLSTIFVTIILFEIHFWKYISLFLLILLCVAKIGLILIFIAAEILRLNKGRIEAILKFHKVFESNSSDSVI